MLFFSALKAKTASNEVFMLLILWV